MGDRPLIQVVSDGFATAQWRETALTGKGRMEEEVQDYMLSMGRVAEGLENICSTISARPPVAVSVNPWPCSTKSDFNRRQAIASWVLLSMTPIV